MSKLTTNHKEEMILASARKIFYEKGYTDAFLAHIAKDCGMSKQLLIYYYPTKADLADAVISSISTEIKHLVEKRMLDYFGGMDDLQVCTALEIKLGFLLYLRDERAMRFQSETLFLSCAPGNSRLKDISFYNMHDKLYSLNIDHDRDELRLLASIYDMTGGVLLANYAAGMYKCTEGQLLDYSIEVLYRLMRIPQERIDEINRMSNTILELLDFKFKPYFVVE